MLFAVAPLPKSRILAPAVTDVGLTMAKIDNPLVKSAMPAGIWKYWEAAKLTAGSPFNAFATRVGLLPETD